MKDGQFKCCACEQWKSDNDMHPWSSDPYSPPICSGCLEKELEEAREKGKDL